MAQRARSWSPLLVVLVLSVAGCRCGDEPGLGNARLGFRPQEEEVDFGRVLEGERGTRQVTLVATGRATTEVQASAESPFAATTPEVSVPGSGSTVVEVTFLAGHGAAEGELVLRGAGSSVSVRLKGQGVRPLKCDPSGPCFASRFDLESGTCVETPLTEGATCIPESRCQVDGRCESGACVGSPRSCDDDNPCTVDACSPQFGCVRTDVVCPDPNNPCKVGLCDRDDGCQEVDVADFVRCGAMDCEQSLLCFGGSCKAFDTPEGTVCAPATACQEVGKCQGGACTRPPPGDFEADFSQDLGGIPSGGGDAPMLLVDEGTLFTSVCGGDAGCRLVSFTEGGLLRYAAPYPEDAPRALLAVSDAGVVVRGPKGLEAYAARAPGARKWEASWTALGAPEGAGAWRGVVGAGQVALTSTGDVVASVAWSQAADAGEDGGASPPPPEGQRWVWLDGHGDAGTVLYAGPVEPWHGETRLGLDPADVAYRYTVDGLLERAEVVTAGADGGPGLRVVTLEDAGPLAGLASLSVSDDQLLVGARTSVFLDGGVVTKAEVDWDGGTRTLAPMAEPVLLAAEEQGAARALLLARACARTDGVPCQPEEERLVLRGVAADTGRGVWEADVLPFESLEGTPREATLLQRGQVGLLVDVLRRDGRQVWFEVYSEGKKVSACPLPGRPTFGGATFFAGKLLVVVEREGVWRLESYAMGPGVLAETRGWPQRHATGAGTRRGAP
ncbi:hypothetical protein LZ198_25755 [Myxococcus sp. K15C18031901]|uniref:hypothetical protein n=1 Tax=Myxococcus dinghuensis TaxID=2906761 RepID=UPI0020A6FFB8|nr:hypothetical protein [Myxococcus dinghuensis]MCP3102280.1 hypothetical protein [Myxococcus dinghuensis]